MIGVQVHVVVVVVVATATADGENFPLRNHRRSVDQQQRKNFPGFARMAPGAATFGAQVAALANGLPHSACRLPLLLLLLPIAFNKVAHSLCSRASHRLRCPRRVFLLPVRRNFLLAAVEFVSFEACKSLAPRGPSGCPSTRYVRVITAV